MIRSSFFFFFHQCVYCVYHVHTCFRFVYPLNLPDISVRVRTSKNANIKKREKAQSHIIIGFHMQRNRRGMMKKDDGIEDESNIHLTGLKRAFEELCECTCSVMVLLLSLFIPAFTRIAPWHKCSFFGFFSPPPVVCTRSYIVEYGKPCSCLYENI